MDLDFCGIKGQPELTTHFATMDVTEAFLNDPYDWDGPKAPHVCATEADMDGALTMQLLQSLSGHARCCSPTSGTTTRDRDIWDLCNSGQHATWFAARSDDPAENLRPRPPLSRRSSTSPPAAPPSTTSPRPGGSRSRG